MQVTMNCVLRVRGCIITMPRFDMTMWLALHEKYQCRWAFVAPPIVLGLTLHPAVDPKKLSLKYLLSGAAPLSGELAKKAVDKLGCEVLQGVCVCKRAEFFYNFFRKSINRELLLITIFKATA